ncbi:YcaO-like family protein [Algoriphagus sp. Y33]|uniref:YcaO-like family protein n=1 Tax=Algoriphagus sp. Y33 TaxID=2772483 RepID=UPI00177BB504|nr:YcaO-like family protein [Algoriphagus sp. Y33]
MDFNINIPIERSYSLQEAEKELSNELDKRGYQYEFQYAGSFVNACKCVIKDRNSGNLLASGNGKGELEFSRIGSLFEATEHLFSDYNEISPDKVIYLGISDFCRGNALCNTLPLVILKKNRNDKMPFLKYKAVNGQENCFYPLALSCPTYIDLLLKDENLLKKDLFNYERLEHYSSNSGTAIGMSSAEAIIHGLLENIERNSLSKFLTKTFLLNKKKHLRLLNPKTLPYQLRNLLNRTEKELDSKIMIFEMPNKFDIPTFCCWMERYENEVGITGYGCSLSVDHAISRSLYEVAQCFLLGKYFYGDEWRKRNDEEILAPLNGLKFHQACAKINLGIKCKELDYTLIRYNQLPNPKFSINPDKYLSELTSIIYSKGEIPFSSELNNIGEKINITHTFITGEDRFFNVTQGKTTFPQEPDIKSL